jgi:hypothetical protein
VGLRIEFEPFERIAIGESLITNSDTRVSFLIGGKEPILVDQAYLASSRERMGRLHWKPAYKTQDGIPCQQA